MKTETKIIGGIFLAIIIILGGILVLDNQDKKVGGISTQPLMGQEIPIQGSNHVKEGEKHEPYNSHPPASGPHYTGVAGSGIHSQEVADELLVHSLEHGAVILSFRPDLPKEDIEKIKKVFNSASGKKIMTPRPNLDVVLALTSWGRLLKLETVDETKIKDFIEINNDRAPEQAPI